MTFKVDKKSGFESYSPVVCIYRNGEPFYAIKRDGMRVLFNLPPGEYKLLAGKLKRLDRPVIYDKIKLPKPERLLKFSGKLKFYFIDNPNKCTVDLGDKYLTRVYFDHSFKSLPWVVQLWVVGHELGHYLYGGHGQISEQNCDHYSANMLLKIGYNPTQIDAAIENAISNGYHARIRKDKLYENLIKIKGR